MFLDVARFELRYQLRQPVFWIVTLVFFLLTFGMVTIEELQLADGGNVLRNSPFAIARAHMMLSIFFMFVTTAFVANVVVRDDDSGFGPIIRATPIRKLDYLFGRFAGAFMVASLCLLVIPLAMYVGTLMPWVDAEVLGPNRLRDYAFAYCALALPNAWFTAALFFAVATSTRSMMWTYICVVGVLVLYTASQAFLDRPALEHATALLDPFALSAMKSLTKYWTVTDRNTLIPEFTGLLFWNRMLWVVVGFALLAVAYAVFHFETRSARPVDSKAPEAGGNGSAAVVPLHAAIAGGPVPERHNARIQFLARIRFELLQVFKGPAFIVVLLFGVLNAVAGLWFAADDLYGTEVFPVTRVMIQALVGAFAFVPIIIAVYYAGELVWRDRERRMHEIIDATPAPDWTFAVPKALAIALVLFAVLGVSVLAAMLVQLLKGYTHFEIGKYLLWYVLPYGLDWSLLAILAVFLQAVSPHKFIGWGLMVLFLIFTLVAGSIGWDHNLYLYGGSPTVPLSDMNGVGRFGVAAAWFRAYWSAFAIMLLVLAHALWRRGAETKLAPRLRRLPQRLMGPAGAIAAVSLVVLVVLGGYIFLNTNIWNEYRTQPGDDQYTAEYEKTLIGFRDVPQPTMTDVKLEMDLAPHFPRLKTRGSYVLSNTGTTPLEYVHVGWSRDLKMAQLSVAGTELEKSFGHLNYRIYRFVPALAPGERRQLKFESVLEQRGFKNRGNITRLVDNGSFVDNFAFAPTLGVQTLFLLKDRATRRKYGLPAEQHVAKLEDESARGRNYVGVDRVNSDITITTVADQTPIAPGNKVSDVTKNGRRTARFVSDRPIHFFFSVQSARYTERVENYKGIELAIYYDQQHPWNVERMMTALKTGMDYFQANFSPYQYRQARILEFPAYDMFAQAFAGTMPYSESIGFIANFRDPNKVEYVTFVTAHELGHQWWAHQVLAADTQGATLLSETLAQYSSMMVMEKLYGPDEIRKFLKFELDEYLKGRGKEPVEELPLMRVENQSYIHYNKGALVLYLLRDRLGEDAVNSVLRDLIHRFAFKAAPYPTSLELVNGLRAVADAKQQDLITDLFERITLYDLQASVAQAKQRPDGRFDVTLEVRAHKRYADGKGKETEAPLDESFDIGLFTAEPGRGNFDTRNVVLMQRMPLHSGQQTFTFTVDQLPTYAGVDPYNKWIDRNSDDNLVLVRH